MEKSMDRRQKKSREAIFKAFTELLSSKHYSKITVGEIIERADIGRATFYAHFETKDFLLKELCQELFCHIFDTSDSGRAEHRHIFNCEGDSSALNHLLRHLQRNDNNVLLLLKSRNNQLFLNYFRQNLESLLESELDLKKGKHEGIPEPLLKKHAVATFMELLKWWVEGGMVLPPETVSEYFMKLI